MQKARESEKRPLKMHKFLMGIFLMFEVSLVF